MSTQSNGHKKKTLETVFGTTSWTTFGNAMTAAGTTLEDQRGAPKDQLMQLLEEFKFAASLRGKLADALLAYFTATPPRLQPKREREEKKPSTFRFTCKFIKGARCIDLRRSVYAKAQKMLAFDGKIEYSLPKGKKIIDGDCDLDIELIFEEKRDALLMRNYATEAWKLWGMEHSPVISVEECEHVVKNAVMESHYDQKTSPSREKMDGAHGRCDSDGSPTHATTVIDQETIDQESVVDTSKVFVEFHHAHIEAKLKGKPRDGDSNILPLPSDWHDIFDGKTPGGQGELMSIAPVPDDVKYKTRTGLGGRKLVLVDVYFANPLVANEFFPKLRAGAFQVRPQVYRVGIFKKNVEQFKKHLSARHNEVVKKWSAVP